MAKQTWTQKVQAALQRLLSGTPLGKQTRVPTTEKAQRAAARGHAAGEYHFGRVSTIRDAEGAFVAYRVGPVPDPSGESYRGARQATLDHVIKMLNRLKGDIPIVVRIYGRWYPGDKVFKWFSYKRDREQLILDIQAEQAAGSSVETAVHNLFLKGNAPMPDLLLAWEVYPTGTETE